MPAFADQVETSHEFHSVGLVDGILETDRLASSNGRNSLLHQALRVANFSLGEPISGWVGCLRRFAWLSALRGTGWKLLEGNVHKGRTSLFSL